MNLERDLDRGARAERLLADPLLKEAFDLVRQAIFEAWEAAPIRDREAAHEFKLQLHLLKSVIGNLEQALNDGKIAAEEIRRLSRPMTPAEFSATHRR